MRAIHVGFALAAAVTVLAPSMAADKPAAYELERRMAVNGKSRMYMLIRPEKDAFELPLVIVYHGGGQTAARARRYTQFDRWAAAERYVAVYPQGLDNNWNDGRLSSDLAARAAGEAEDVEFTRQIIEELAGEGFVDRRRVYLTGASNGGMMAMRAACELGDRVAGIAAVVANMPVDWECAAKRMPALFIHGTDDEFMPFAGGQVAATKSRRDLGTVRSVDETIAIFKTMNGCSGVKETKTIDKITRDKTAAVVTDYACQQAPLKQIVIQGGGHTWPGARDNIVAELILGQTSREVSATAEIWNFFKALGGP
jgi:polyhydroxybutyrate depolymerase